MRIIIKSKNLELTPSLNNFIEKKFQGLKKYIKILKTEEEKRMKTLAEVFVEIEKETQHHRKGEIFWAKAEIILPGKKLMAKSKSEDMAKALVEVKEQLVREIKKYKVKKIDTVRRGRRKAKEDTVF